MSTHKVKKYEFITYMVGCDHLDSKFDSVPCKNT